MLVSLSGKVKMLFPRTVDCGLVIKSEGISVGGGYIFKLSQLRLAGIPLYPALTTRRAVVIRKQDGKRFKEHCSLAADCVVVL